jgi:tRNA 2-thiouridine synthesizing protein D|tara:strand:+ start:4525 stop:4911 length:387 start_codon:yes stop_codon:yes gene_type:complete
LDGFRGIFKMGILSIGVFSSLVGSMNTDFVIKLSKTALNKGHKVNIWLSGNAVMLVNKDQKEFKDYSHPGAELPYLIEKGLNVVVCEACANARGLTEKKSVKGTKFTSMDWYLAYGAAGDRMLNIGGE